MLGKQKTWKRIFNTNSELSQNHAEKQIMSFKTTVIACLVMVCFDWKIAFFQQTVIKVYYMLNVGLSPSKKLVLFAWLKAL